MSRKVAAGAKGAKGVGGAIAGVGSARSAAKRRTSARIGTPATKSQDEGEGGFRRAEAGGGAGAVGRCVTAAAAGAEEAHGGAREAGAASAGEQGLVLGASRKGVQKRTGRASDWTREKADRFIAVLGDSCNVSLAARAIRRSVSNVYLQRARDAEFRAAWDQALATGYARLEMMMLERALHGVEKTVVLKTGESRIMREYNDRVALALLRHHRESVSAYESGIEDADYEEACERIIGKLSRLREREAEGGDARVETKTGQDRIALIALALKLRGAGL